MIIRRLIVPLTAFVMTLGATLGAGQALAQGAFPAPLPGQGIQQNDPAFPPVNGAAPAASIGGPRAFPTNGAAPIAGMKGFLPLREEAERRGKLIKAAGDRHAPPDEACQLIKNFSEVEFKMIKYVETNSAKCGIPPQVGDQLKAGHKNTEGMRTKVCGVAQQAQSRGPAGPR